METPTPPPAYVPPVSPEPPKKPKTGLIIGIVVGVLGLGGCAIVAILAAILFPVFSQAKEAARATLSLSHVKQCAHGSLMYMADHDDHLPLRNTWMDVTGKYVGSNPEQDARTTGNSGSQTDAVFRSPALGDDPNAYGYAFNADLAGIKASKLKSPETTILIFDSTVTDRNATAPTATLPSPGRYRRDGQRKNTIAYADGFAKLVATP